MPYRSCEACIVAILVGYACGGLAGQVKSGCLCAGSSLLPKCTTELSLSVGMYELAAPGKTTFHPVLIEFGKEDLACVPEERTRFLSINSFALAYLTADEVRTFSAHPAIVCMGLGGEPVKSAAEARAHLRPDDVRMVKPARALNVLLAVIDINSHVLASLNEDFANKVVFQCISGKGHAAKADNDITSVHGAQMAAVCRRFAPDVHFALYDGNLEKSDIVIGLDIIHAYAKSLGVPTIVNLSASSQAGSHDGLSVWERALDRYVDDDYFIVTSSGNTFDSDVHLVITTGSLGDDNSVDIPFVMDSGTPNARFELHLWFRGHSPMSYHIVGLTDAAIEVGPDSQFCSVARESAVLTAYQGESEDGGDANITLAARFDTAPPSRVFVVRLFWAAGVGREIRCDGWISSTPSGLISCPPYATKRGTIESFSCSPGIISVGTFCYENGERVFQGLGPTRDGRFKPDLFVKTQATTSYAAAIVSGLLAQVMETEGMNDPRKALTCLLGQYKWLLLPEAVYGDDEDAGQSGQERAKRYEATVHTRRE